MRVQSCPCLAPAVQLLNEYDLKIFSACLDHKPGERQSCVVGLTSGLRLICVMSLTGSFLGRAGGE